MKTYRYHEGSFSSGELYVIIQTICTTLGQKGCDVAHESGHNLRAWKTLRSKLQVFFISFSFPFLQTFPSFFLSIWISNVTSFYVKQFFRVSDRSWSFLWNLTCTVDLNQKPHGMSIPTALPLTFSVTAEMDASSKLIQHRKRSIWSPNNTVFVCVQRENLMIDDAKGYIAAVNRR